MSGVLAIPASAPSTAGASAKAGGSKNPQSSTSPSDRSAVKKVRDEAYKAIRAAHRFDGFAPERSGNAAKWYIDGHDFMWAISELIDSAKQQICLLDWWLSPEVYLRRPPEQFQDWRLDRLLLKKATQGVKIHIIVYKEVEGTSPLDSVHTENALESLHPNIAVMRHPDHSLFSAEDVFFWSHHEKLVLVDNKYVSMGGLDLCFGRWDTHNHPLADAHPSGFDRTLFPGQDYNNSRILDFQTVDQFVLNQLSNLDTGRMPWHDVSLILSGPSVLDAAQHFVERWNYIKTEKYANNSRYDWLPLPHTIENLFNFPSLGANAQRMMQRHPMRKEWGNKGKDYLERFLGFIKRHSRESSRTQPSGSQILGSTCNVQVVRSASIWSHDVPTEISIQNAYISLIHDAKHFIYIENQFFISSTAPGGPIVNQIAAAITERIVRAAKAGEKFKVIVAIPEVPAFPGVIKDTDTVRIIMGAQWRTINRAGASIVETVKLAGYDPANYIMFYHLRSYDRINGPTSFIQKVAAQTGVSYDQTQAALERIWLGDIDPKRAGDGDKVPNSIHIHKPQGPLKAMATVPGSGAGVGIPTLPIGPGGGSGNDGKPGDDGTKDTLPIPPTVAAAMEILNKFQEASTAADKAVNDSVSGHALEQAGTLEGESWVGTEEEKKDCYVSELTYIHSKLMIVDDLRVVIGSANLNDRSMKGDGDSEIAVVVEDTDMIASRMNGQPYQAARFAVTLRRVLFKEHLGLVQPQQSDPATANDVNSYMTPPPNAATDTTQSPEDALVEDPLSDQFQTLWNETAKKNTDIFLKIFKTVPNNLVKSWKDYDAYVPDVTPGHVATDLTPAQITEQLSQVRGHLVQGTMDFLIEEEGLVTGLFWSNLNFLLPIWV